MTFETTFGESIAIEIKRGSCEPYPCAPYEILVLKDFTGNLSWERYGGTTHFALPPLVESGSWSGSTRYMIEAKSYTGAIRFRQKFKIALEHEVINNASLKKFVSEISDESLLFENNLDKYGYSNAAILARIIRGAYNLGIESSKKALEDPLFFAKDALDALRDFSN